jgi:hypothetical protein
LAFKASCFTSNLLYLIHNEQQGNELRVGNCHLGKPAEFFSAAFMDLEGTAKSDKRLETGCSMSF